MSWQRLDGCIVWKLCFYAMEELERQEVGDLLHSEEQVVEGLDVVLVLREYRRHDIYRLRWEEEYPLSASLGDDSNEAFDLGNPRSRD